ncbi:hypothetical protein ILYODFUR_000528 [Ilyodon furcidens]|uniref:Uncharacterized protein n=1 Tax=Ilyodon furcidens TaxID=33524 RepID=A0ABV0UQP8_9TELE
MRKGIRATSFCRGSGSGAIRPREVGLGHVGAGFGRPSRSSASHLKLVARRTVYLCVLCFEAWEKSCRDNGDHFPEKGSPAFSPIMAIAASPLQPDTSSSLPSN